MHEQSDSRTFESERATQKISLSWDVFLAPSIPAITSDLPPVEKERPWPPISSTLISGERDAVLVDAPITVEQARALANWVAARGKNLTIICQQKRQEWIAALDKMESLKPRAVIAGHKRVANDDSPKILGETRKYIRDFERLAMQTTTARELYDEMLKLYPDWINRGALWTSVRAVKS